MLIEHALAASPTRNERDCREPACIVEIFVNVKRIEGSIQSAEAWLETQAAFHLMHEWVEVTDIRLVEGLRQFSQEELTPIRNLGGNDP